MVYDRRNSYLWLGKKIPKTSYYRNIKRKKQLESKARDIRNEPNDSKTELEDRSLTEESGDIFKFFFLVMFHF